jgi:hypothetical protein
MTIFAIIFIIYIQYLCFFQIQASDLPADYPFYYEYNHTTKSFDHKVITLPPTAWSLNPKFKTFREDRGTWYSTSEYRHGQDNMVRVLVDDKEDGYFVDLATNHYKDGSNTYSFEYYSHNDIACIKYILEAKLPAVNSLNEIKCCLLLIVNQPHDFNNLIKSFTSNEKLKSWLVIKKGYSSLEVSIPKDFYYTNGNVIADANNPYGLTFDPSYVFAPNQGIRVFFGMRYSFDK